MFVKTILVAAAALTSFASAQNSSNLPPGISDCCSVSATQIPTDTKDQWCQAERNTCPEICGGVNNLASGGQTCDTTTLNYTCTCKNGTSPDMSLYQQSVPGLMCRYWFDLCINATNQNLEYQVACTNQRDSKCGNLTTANTATTSAAASSATASKTGGSSASGSATAASASASKGAATALAVAREYGTSLLAGGMLAIFGLAL